MLYRAVAAGPVSPVSTGPLFPSPIVFLVSCSGVATLGHARARALATRGRAPPVQH